MSGTTVGILVIVVVVVVALAVWLIMVARAARQFQTSGTCDYAEDRPVASDSGRP